MTEYPPLLQPGFVDVAIEDLESVFVAQFDDRGSRQALVDSLRRFISVLRDDLGLTGTLWIDGSFVTMKPHPGDIDVVLLVPESSMRRLSPTDLAFFVQLVKNRRDTKLRYRCDLYFCDPDDEEGRSYWRGWFAFDRNENPKGIARLFI